ncbi:MAG: chitobiase/beta-hexosaminidase C-terminal domain-containing protein [Candidatus Woesebacteria bacterium]|nr:MAG: chitobiase/beta-hexosaminidase C-terminal domain-containing protein [Candidatus Woesebacteria bacterium]
MKNKLFRKIISVFATFALLFNSVAPYSLAVAQEITPSPTPDATTQPTEQPTIAPTDTVSPTATPDATPTEIASPTPEVTATPTDLATPTPSETPAETQAPESSPTVQGPPSDENKQINESANLQISTPTATPVVPVEHGNITTTTIENVDLSGITLLNSNLNGASVTTDKPDYSPTSIVLITGTGFTADKTYTIVISSTDEPPVTHIDSVTADTQGTFSYAYQLDGNYRPDYKIEVKSGEVVVASTSFTDNGAKIDKLYKNAGLLTEGYQFAVNETVYAKATNLTTSRGYKFEAKNSSGVSMYLGACKTGSTTASDSFTPTTVSGSSSWTWILHEWSSNTCSSGPQSEDSDNTLAFNVAQATAYTTSGLSTTTTSYLTGATAYVKINGLHQNDNDWDVTWIKPDGTTACANTSSGDRPNSSSNGVLPDSSPSYLEYQPSTGSNNWNDPTKYDGSCPAFTSGNTGLWKLIVSQDSTHTVTFSVFSVATPLDTTPPNTTIDSGPSENVPSTSATFAFSANETSTFECKLDGASFSTCTSTKSYSSLSQGSHTFQVRATDTAGNVDSTPASQTWTVDTVAPTISAAVSAGTLGSNGWYTSDVTVHFTCADTGGSGIASCPTDQILSTEGSSVSSTAQTATDNAGNTSALSNVVTVKIDKTGPTATLVVTAGDLGLNDWYTSDVTVATSCFDGISAITAYTSDQSQTTDTAGQTFNGWCENWAGLTTNASPLTIKLDKTSPTATFSYSTTSPTNSDVLATLVPSETVTVTNNGGLSTYNFTSNDSFTFEFRDEAGNIGTATATVDNIDKTAPTVTYTDPTPANGTLTNINNHTFKVSLSEEVSSCKLIAENGDFENGLNGWTTGGNTALTTSTYHSSNHSLQLQTTNDNVGGSYNYAFTTANLPGSGLINLNAWLSRSTTDGPYWDQQRIYLTDLSGNMLVDLLYGLENSSWTNVNYDISAYAGQSVRAYFAVHDDGAGDPSRMFVDDVSITGGFQGGEHPMVVDGLEATLDWNDMPDANYNHYVQCTDLAGNNGNSENRTLTIDTQAPVLSDKTAFDDSWYTSDQTSNFDYSDVNGIASGNPASCVISTEGSAQTCEVIDPNVCDNAGNCNHDTVTSNGVNIDKSGPTLSADPPAGNYSSTQFVTLTGSDAGSGVKDIYYTIDGSTPDETKTLYTSGSTITVDDDMTIKAIAYDNIGNASDVLVATYGMAPVISAEDGMGSGHTSARITWTTDRPATSRVVYDTVSHPALDSEPNYGYAFSTGTFDTDPKVLAHSISIDGLSAGTTYYYRTISTGSPAAIGAEHSLSTLTYSGPPSAGGNSGTVLGISTTQADSSWPKLAFAGTTDSNGSTENVLGTETTAGTPSADSTIQTEQDEKVNFMKWILSHKKISLGVVLVLIAVGYYISKRKNK